MSLTSLQISIFLLPLLAIVGCRKPLEKEPSVTTPPLVYGTKVSFAKSGEAGSFKVSGWIEAEEKFSWSDGTLSILRMQIAPTPNPVTLKMTVSGLVREADLSAQPVAVFANDKKIADWKVVNTAVLSAPLPTELTRAGGILTLKFEIPKAVSPKELGISADPRVLGMCVLDLELAK